MRRRFNPSSLLILALQRYLGFLPVFAFSSTLQASWESIAGGLLAGLLNGGPVSLVYGLILSIAGSTAIAASFGEMASMYDRNIYGKNLRNDQIQYACRRCTIPLDT